MPTFAYQARDSKGERISGAHEATDQRAALEALRALGLFVTKLEPAKNGSVASSAATTPAARQEPNISAASEAVNPQLHAPTGREQTSREQSAREQSPSRLSPSKLSPLPAVSTEKNEAPPRATPGSTATPPLPPRYWLRANSKELALFFRQMHAMLNAGTSLAHALNTMATNAPNSALRTACSEMNPRVASGHQFSELMKSYPGIFTPLMTGMIRAGEVGGFLDRMCLRLSEYSERDYEISQTVKRETWYPKLLLFMSFFIPSLVPAIVAMFNNGPWFKIWVGAFIGPASLMLAAFLIWKFRNYLAPLFKHIAPLTYIVDQVKLLIPIAGKTTRSLATAKFCRALGALQAAGMGVQQTINLSADACGNAVIAESSRKAIRQIEGGASITDALEATRQFPGVAIQMLRTGENTGNFDQQLDKVADFLETDAETTIKQSVVVLGIVIFLCMAIYIGIQVISQYVGMYSGFMDQAENLAE